MKKVNKVLFTSLLASLLVSCGGQVESNPAQSTPASEPQSNQSSEPSSSNYQAIDANTTGELWVMTWSGDGKDYKDIGNNPLPYDEVTALNVGMLQGIAKAFNRRYPNIKINIHTEIQDPASGGSSWSEKLINFKENHQGKYPDVWASFNIIDDLNKGIVADLSVFEEDPDYQKFNPNLMNLMNYYGFQAGLPQYAIPWGIYVNRELATKQNISSPAVDWTWDEYTHFISQTKASCAAGEVCGTYNVNMRAPQGAFIERQLQTTEKGSEYKVEFANADFIEAISKLPEQAEASATFVLSARAAEGDEVAANYMAKGNQYSYNYFKDNLVLTHEYDPWMIFESAAEGSTNYINSKDWDIYPRPAFEREDGSFAVDNHVGVCLDPLAVYNYALDDSNPELSAEEYARLNIAWTFAKFWVGDTEAWEGKANSKYTEINPNTNEPYQVPAINDTFPAVVQGEDFDRQMEIWFSTTNHAPYQDATKFRGFAKVIDLWSKGMIYGISDKAFPRYYHLEGDSTDYSILSEIENFWNEEVVGVSITDPAWLSTYRAFLRTYNARINERYNQAFSELKATLKQYYGWTDNSFSKQ